MTDCIRQFETNCIVWSVSKNYFFGFLLLHQTNFLCWTDCITLLDFSAKNLCFGFLLINIFSNITAHLCSWTIYSYRGPGGRGGGKTPQPYIHGGICGAIQRWNSWTAFWQKTQVFCTMQFTVTSTGGFFSLLWYSQTQVFYSNSWGGEGFELCLLTFKTTVFISRVSVYLLFKWIRKSFYFYGKFFLFSIFSPLNIKFTFPYYLHLLHFLPT